MTSINQQNIVDWCLQDKNISDLCLFAWSPCLIWTWSYAVTSTFWSILGGKVLYILQDTFDSLKLHFKIVCDVWSNPRSFVWQIKDWWTNPNLAFRFSHITKSPMKFPKFPTRSCEVILSPMLLLKLREKGRTAAIVETLMIFHYDSLSIYECMAAW